MSDRPVNLAEQFAALEKPWHPALAARVNDMDVRVARLEGRFDWHHHETEDEFFLVIDGTLLMHFRDRSETLAPGEFIVVPAGVEHCPEAADGPVNVLLFEKSTAVNTGTAVNDRTVTVSATDRAAAASYAVQGPLRTANGEQP